MFACGIANKDQCADFEGKWCGHGETFCKLGFGASVFALTAVSRAAGICKYHLIAIPKSTEQAPTINFQ